VTRLKLGIQILNRAGFKNYEIKAYLLMQFRESFINYSFFFKIKIQIVARYIQIQKKPMNILKKKNNEQDIKD
jgi:hypothetical protein